MHISKSLHGSLSSFDISYDSCLSIHVSPTLCPLPYSSQLDDLQNSCMNNEIWWSIEYVALEKQLEKANLTWWKIKTYIKGKNLINQSYILGSGWELKSTLIWLRKANSANFYCIKLKIVFGEKSIYIYFNVQPFIVSTKIVFILSEWNWCFWKTKYISYLMDDHL